MVNISCFYIHYNRNPVELFFIQYKNYIKVILNNRTVVLSNELFMNIYNLYEYYLLSLICTENSNILYKNNHYGISTKKYWKQLYFTKYYSDIFSECHLSKNPLNSSEPKKQTSNKKIKRFINQFDLLLNNDPVNIIYELIDSECKDVYDNINKLKIIIEIDKRISILSCIKHKFGNDIYDNIRKFL